MRLPSLTMLAALMATQPIGAWATPLVEQPMSVVQTLIANAQPGGVVLVPPGVYVGNLVIGAPLTLEGADRAILDAGGSGTVVEIRSPDVTIRGFTIRNSGDDVTSEPAGIRAVAGPVTIENNRVLETLFGIDLRESPGSTIRTNRIRGKRLDPGRRGDGIRLWWSHGCTVEDNTVSRSRDMVFWYSENLSIARNRVSASRYGLHFMYSHDTTLSENDLDGNSVGIYLMYSNRITLTDNLMRNNRGASGYGVGLKDCDDIVITGNAMLANRVGAYIDNSPSSVDSTGLFEANTIAFNEIGILATPNTHDNIFTGNAIIENEQAAATHGRGALTKNRFARDGVGNFWSDYAGFDRDADGIGDLAYEPKSLFGAMLAREPNLRLFVHSPAQRAIEFTARALPELRPDATLVDPAPLVTPPRSRSSTTSQTRPGLAMICLAIALVGGAGAAVVTLARPDRLLARPNGAMS